MKNVWNSLQAEADLAASRVLELRTFLMEEAGGAPPTAPAAPPPPPPPRPISVGVITPYKQQVAVLRATFRRVVGAAAAEVRRVQGTGGLLAFLRQVNLGHCHRKGSSLPGM